ncbi:GGDEF and EAL domain-containing protein [Candidatus Marinarcus aquaticus]|uniref:EAL domain-containing protein n=1 Tax=Candidatus Marinarcus aquaticus TaxID=2044504 RepID=A0A4Q0XT86_9BACT|nr:GGDEF and EAL domain-containing protein [Candidatus Marinarcus aquaticus]RXJ57996.1 hypothetical protein CRV04_05680 [Candidatus Marinarcus aquaticus]
MQRYITPYSFSIDDLSLNVVIYEHINDDFKLIDINKNALRDEGLEKESIIGHYITEIFPNIKEFGLFDALFEVYQSGEKKYFSFGYYNNHFISSWREIEIIKLNDDFIMVMYKNISARKSMEHKLTSLGIIVDNSFNEIYIINAKNYTITYCNKQAQQNIQYSYEEILNLHPWQIATQVRQEDFKKRLKINKKFIIFETQHQRKDGSYYDVEIRIQKIKIDKEAQYIAIVLDTSHKKAMEEQLSLSKEIIENVSEAIVVTTIDARIIDINPAYTRITGFKKEQMVGKNPSVLKSGRHSKEFYKEMWESLHTKGSWSGEIWDRKKTGEIFPKMLYINTIYDRYKQPKYYVGIFQDITHIKENEETLRRLAFYDPLTGLANRTNFESRLEHAINLNIRNNTSGALLLLDLDNFKMINDSLGHLVGDELLVQVAKRLEQIARKSDSLCRIGGDEFTIILSGPIELERIHLIAKRILKNVKEPYHIMGQEIFITTSMGITLFPDEGTHKLDVIKNADLAMYQAKNDKKDSYKFFKYEMNDRTLNFLRVESDLRKALNNDEILLHYQPKIDPYRKKVVSVEALVRWNHPKKGLVYPDEFLSIAESSGLINPMGEIILHKAMSEIKQLNEELKSQITVAINLSTKQFTDRNLKKYIFGLIKSLPFDVNLLELEITESLIMDNVEHAIELMHQFVKKGISISIDDFGTGYSSLNYLKKFPIKYLKIDRSFVKDITNDEDDKAIVSAVISMAKNLGIEVIAEGVETKEHEAFLMQHECNLCQGYYYSKPVDLKRLKAFILEYNQ